MFFSAFIPLNIVCSFSVNLVICFAVFFKFHAILSVHDCLCFNRNLALIVEHVCLSS